MTITLDEDAQSYLVELRERRHVAQSREFKVEDLREQETRLRGRYGHGPEMHSELHVPAAAEVPRHVVLDPSAEPAGTLVYFHGGGWVFSEPEDYLAVCRALASASGWRVVVGDYRKAPEHPFPAAFDDAMALAREFAKRTHSSDADDQTPLGIAGDSAGGNLAAAVAAEFGKADRGILAVQVLITPVLDIDTSTASYRDPARQLSLTRDDMVWFIDQYTRPEHGRDSRLCPLRTPHPDRLPATIFVSVRSDVLRSEGTAYIQLLEHAGVPVHHREFPGQLHGFFQLYNVMPASADAVAWISSNLHAIAQSRRAMQSSAGVTK